MDCSNRKFKGVQFGFYSKEEILSLASVEVKNMVSFDEFKNPISGGLYDPKMGVGPYDRFGKCPTCSKSEKDCQGHFGYIKLILPIYNLHLMKTLEKILKMKCFDCHKILLPPVKTKEFINMFSLLQYGKVNEFLKLEELFQMRSVASLENVDKKKRLPKKKSFKSEDTEDQTKKSERSRSRSAKDDDKIEEEDLDDENINIKKMMSNLKENKEVSKFQKELYIKLSKMIKTKKKELKKGFSELNDSTHTSTSFKEQLIYNLQKELIKECTKSSRCFTCKAPRSNVRKEGNVSFCVTRTLNEDNSSKKGILDKPEKNKKLVKKTKVFDPNSIKEHLQSFYYYNKKLLDMVFGKVMIPSLCSVEQKVKVIPFKIDDFFMELLSVTPNRFRPDNKLGDQIFLHSHTTMYIKIMSINEEIKKLISMKEQKSEKTSKKEKKSNIISIFGKWMELQETVNLLFDSTQSSKMSDKDPGIKQLLEKKEGLFRMKMMGKRVNFSARSVISPDPNLDTREVGVPIFMAKKLMFPEKVTPHNVVDLRKLIINGPKNYPGAHFVEEDGRKILLDKQTMDQRKVIANQLLNNAENKTVYRQLLTGDALLFNRQPTLHKNSMTVHQARVLPHGLTIRFHYANCSGYNADFDGDEMNLHFLQNHEARAEALHIALNDKQMILSTNKNPVRGLVQDYVFSPMLLSLKNVFLRRNEFFQLLYIGMFSLMDKSQGSGLLGLDAFHERALKNSNQDFEEFWLRKIKVIKPAVFKPEELWTGKQLFSNIIKLVAEYGEEVDHIQNETGEAYLSPQIGICMKKKTRVNEQYLCNVSREDSQLIIRNNIIMSGIIDKNAVGSAKFGIIHSFYELYGPHKAGILMSSITKMCTNFLKLNGYTCGMGDLILNEDFEQKRNQLMGNLHLTCINALSKMVEKDSISEEFTKNPVELFKQTQSSKKYSNETLQIRKGIANKILSNTNGRELVDSEARSSFAGLQSELYKSMYNGLKCKFPDNKFSGMVLPGAKGSILNHNQVSSNLGQQSLEGQRVPIMASGKTLPSFLPYDPNPRSGGFIGDRFLTGLRPQEFYYHCMAGREGLVDTAVKTSRSGYLQRMLVKNLEALVIGYDNTVRDVCDQSLVQFSYGEDGLDSMKVNTLENLDFMLDNFETYKKNLKISEIKKSVDYKSVYKCLEKLKKDNIQIDAINQATMQEKFDFSKNLGSTSLKAYNKLNEFVESRSEKLAEKQIPAQELKVMHDMIYLTSLAHPGDSVGAVAAQSFGEPSTQMTLNTFHLAGHGGANVTLGIPRLRELLSTRNIKNPMMMIPFKRSISDEDVKKFYRSIQKVTILQLIKSINIEEEIVCFETQVNRTNLRTNQIEEEENSNKPRNANSGLLNPSDRFKRLKVNLEFENRKAVKSCFDIEYEQISNLIKSKFIPKFEKILSKLDTRASSISNKGQTLMKNIFDEMDKEEANKSSTKIKKKKKKNSKNEHFIQEKDEMNDKSDDDQIIEEIVEDQDHKIDSDDDLIEEVSSLNNEKPKQKSSSVKKKKQEDSLYLTDFDITKIGLNITFNLSLQTKRTLFIPLIQKLLSKISLREILHIQKTHLIKNSDPNPSPNDPKYTIQTEGINFAFAWKHFKYFDLNNIESNDVQVLSKIYGIEAGRNALAKEVNKVFSHYGIAVDFRHMSLVADHMSFPGQINPMSRMGMQFAQSPLLKMSFETSMKFLIDACEQKGYDNFNTASGNIIVGEHMKNGTGAFEIIDCSEVKKVNENDFGVNNNIHQIIDL